LLVFNNWHDRLRHIFSPMSIIFYYIRF